MPVLNFEYLLYLIYDFFVTLFSIPYDTSLRAEIWSWIDWWWWTALFVSIPILLLAIFFFVKTQENWREMHERVYGKPGIIAEIKEELNIVPPAQNETWVKITKLISSDNPNDWKLAIIEADKVLEMVVNTFAVPGDNMGDKMKNIEKSDFLTLEEAWQAHKVRNRIAHEHNFHLSEREARLALDNYEKVFREFDFI